jgi:hypothetical protein
MRTLMRTTLLALALLATGCVLVPVGRPCGHCGYYCCR